MVLDPLKRLLYSRKFFLALAYVLVAVLQGDPELIAQAVHDAVLVLIAAIAVEDAAAKINGK